MTKAIVYTRADSGVSICYPTSAIIYWLGRGGFWGRATRGFCDAQIERQIARGVRADAAARYVRAMLVGGCTEAEAYGIIRDRDCAHLGTGCELWDVALVPVDRRYRDAWRRSHNGGPITIDDRVAQAIDERLAWQAYEASHGAR